MKFVLTPVALAIAGALTVSVSQARAQGTDPLSTPDAQTAPTQMDRVTVTGSRVVRAGFDTLEPATVVTRRDVEAQGLTNIAEALRIPGFGAGVTPEANQSSFGTGVNFVNRFGLGSNRTLTLINGRRVVSSNTPSIFGPANPGGQVDLNIIATSMLDRVENLAIGGAPTYGADAIAGVVNLITRKGYDGLEMSATHGFSQVRDGNRNNVSVLWGKNFADDRANVTLSYVFDNQEGVLGVARGRGDRAISLRSNPCVNGASSIATTQPNRTPANDGRINTGTPFQTCLPTAATDGIPNSVYIENDRNFTFTTGGLLFPATGAFNLADNRLRGFGPNQTTYLHFDRTGTLVPYNPGFNFGNLNASGGDGFKLADTTQVTSKVERRTINVLASYRVTNSIDLFYEGLFYQAKALELADQAPFNANAFGGLSAPLTFSSTYPLLSPSAVATLQANGITSFRLSRINTDLAANNGRGSTDLQRSVIGARGEFEIGRRSYNWEVSANIGTNDSVFYGSALNQQNFINALNVARDASGSIVCSTIPTPGLVIPGGGAPKADPNCMPLSLFGNEAGTAAARAYVNTLTATRSKIEQRVLNANVGGNPFDTWGGPVGLNVGLERRTESGAFTPDDFQTAGLGRAVAILGNQGSYTTNEAFGEVLVPLIDSKKNLPLLNRLDFTGKFRRVNSSVNGTADTYTYGLQFKPIPDVEIRGNFTRALRSPSLTELYTPTSNIFTTVPDPCDSRNIASGTNPAQRAINCGPFYTQYGLNPSTFLSTAVTATIPGTSSGSPTLLNEQSDAKNVGVVLRPRAVKNLRMSIDYFEIRIADAISNLNAGAIATGCYDNPDTVNPFCGRIARDGTGQIIGVTTGFVNGGTLEYKGAAAEIQYSTDLKDWSAAMGGKATFGMNVSRLYSLKTSTNKVVTLDSAGEIGSTDQGQISLGYENGAFDYSLLGNYIGPAVFNNTESSETRDIRSIEPYMVWSGGIGYKLNKNTSFRLAVTNLGNREQPFPLTAGGASGVYDILGRRYSVTLNHKF